MVRAVLQVCEAREAAGGVLLCCPPATAMAPPCPNCRCALRACRAQYYQ